MFGSHRKEDQIISNVENVLIYAACVFGFSSCVVVNKVYK